MSTSARDIMLLHKSVDIDVPDAVQGALKSGSGTLLTTAVTTVDIPVGSVGFKIYATTNPIRIAIDEDPVDVGTINSASVGSTIKPGAWDKRLFVRGDERASELRIKCPGQTSIVVDVDFF